MSNHIPHKPGGQAMNERAGTSKFHWSEYANFRDWFATTKWFDDPVYCEIADAAWQAALSAATPRRGVLMAIDTKLKRLEEATKNLDWDARERFDNCFIGALSMEVSDEAWDRALRAATRCMVPAFAVVKPE